MSVHRPSKAGKDSVTMRGFDLAIKPTQQLELNENFQAVRVLIRDGVAQLHCVINRVIGTKLYTVYLVETEEEIDFNLNNVTYIDSFLWQIPCTGSDNMEQIEYHLFIKDRI